MIKAIIIDDEQDCIHSLEFELREHCKNIDVVKTCMNAKEGIKAIHKYDPNVVFLDIDMPVINGFELLELISDINFEIIFTTAHDKFAVQAFKVCALDYLLKPIDPVDLVKAVHKLQESQEKKTKNQVQFLLQHLDELEQNNVKRIALPTMEGLQFIYLNDILYCESDGAYSLLHFTQEKKLLISKSLRYLEEILCEYHFFRVHKSFIVNLNYVVKYTRGAGGSLTMNNGAEIRVSRSKKEELLSLF